MLMPEDFCSPGVPGGAKRIRTCRSFARGKPDAAGGNPAHYRSFFFGLLLYRMVWDKEKEKMNYEQ
jgi:hypothetical protein